MLSILQLRSTSPVNRDFRGVNLRSLFTWILPWNCRFPLPLGILVFPFFTCTTKRKKRYSEDSVSSSSPSSSASISSSESDGESSSKRHKSSRRHRHRRTDKKRKRSAAEEDALDETSTMDVSGFNYDSDEIELTTEHAIGNGTTPSLHDSIALLRSSWTFSQAAIVAFSSSLGELGLSSALLAQFHFDKDQFADLMIINGIAGIISQMVLMPLLARVINEEKILSIGLIFNCIHICLYSVAWSPWVVYFAAMFQILAVFAQASLRSIVSKQVGPTDQGKAQGCITGLCSFASIISPLIFSPLTALFLSDNAPFVFPGFSLVCAAFFVISGDVSAVIKDLVEIGCQ